jgi:hypothetical protein
VRRNLSIPSAAGCDSDLDRLSVDIDVNYIGAIEKGRMDADRSDGIALIFQCKFFLRTVKNRLPDPSEICAIDFKNEFR